ncbi:group III truncated hemoglobin [Marivirga arenosa]|uniref:Group III truncated hemoglobin n=1 Tax=Marivirga arenosa TaxID=3059076 RepID=A0AA49GG39_9BACT|nr:group III truncated hemoglobin [Marivirga sp. BKB1-2]WKK80929.2 group III truncated hemoglobin [Marivirga sp. BKB1-2]
MSDVESRSDIKSLVTKFYSKVREDELLGPIFNKHIANDEWPIHLEKLTDFWESNLFRVQKFKGNPTLKHIKVDQHSNHSIQQLHFHKWLQLWFETLDELFEGEKANKAKFAARRMATGQFMTVWNSRPKEFK